MAAAGAASVGAAVVAATGVAVAGAGSLLASPGKGSRACPISCRWNKGIS